jgi:predicted amidohydrolase YtcJ
MHGGEEPFPLGLPGIMDTSQAQLVLINGVTDSLTPETPRTSALAVRDGKVAALGAEARSLQGLGTEVVDLAEAYAMPGLLDVPNHHLLAG